VFAYHPSLTRCVRTLAQGGVVAYPTEAVWGLGCDPFYQPAVERILQLKRRAADKGLILVAAEMAQFDWLLEGLSAEHRMRLAESWPGPITWLVPHHQRLPRLVHGSHATIALRVSAHPVVQALCQRYGGPIVSTSANPQGLSPARTAGEVRRYFGRQGLCLAAGRIGDSDRPSMIKDLASGKIIRH